MQRVFSSTASRNIYILFVVKALSWFYVALAYLFPYYSGLGLDFQEYLSLIAIFSAGVVLFEFPTGYIGDRLGHHRSIQIGLFFSSCGWLILYTSSTFVFFALAELFMALGVSLVSGSDSALLHESTAVAGNSYKGSENKIHSITSFSEAFGGIAGMLLVVFGVPALIFAQFLLMGAAALFSLLLTPIRGVSISEVTILKDMQRVLAYTFTNTYLFSVIMFSATVGAATFTALWFIQPLLQALNAPLWVFGAVWFVQNAFLGTISLYAASIEALLGERNAIIFLSIATPLLFVTIALLPLTAISIIVFLGFFFVRALLNSFTKASIQLHALDDRRASIMSLQGLAFRLVFVVVGPLVGFISTQSSLSIGLLVSGALFTVAILYPAYTLFRGHVH